LRIGDPAPALHLPTAEGGEFSLADHRGRVVFLDFFRHLY
jgi:peroxiredoxin